MSKKNIISLVIIVLLVAVTVIGLAAGNGGGASKEQNKQLSQLAQCLTEKGAKFYGAYWCSHCAEQKRAFAKAQKELPYVECAVVGSREKQTPECVEKKITGYPTWVFADGSRLNGTITPQKLAEKTDCPYVASESETESIEEGVSAAPAK